MGSHGGTPWMDLWMVPWMEVMDGKVMDGDHEYVHDWLEPMAGWSPGLVGAHNLSFMAI